VQKLATQVAVWREAEATDSGNKAKSKRTAALNVMRT
jgi:hypothetical protein